MSVIHEIHSRDDEVCSFLLVVDVEGGGRRQRPRSTEEQGRKSRICGGVSSEGSGNRYAVHRSITIRLSTTEKEWQR
ncbi:hypothetical protein HMPREF3159_09085 [Brachybacterium sp. HMSC06H03]|nr:hypothetical protein HMPREF3159_09085 [Brachybacterium sp. HMSC06H03]